ncbi:hypothetical protein VTN77DRAFT_5371 [Rasamsonia byssochlamydoides]|uniref:uncharacterized protein n=1 Tax=Rasamsonia byssochlamydoides TaxID=89139 RepID=UPI00374390E3
MDLDHDNGHVMGEDLNGSPPQRTSPKWGRLPDPEYIDGVEGTPEAHNAGMSRNTRVSRKVETDENSQISRAELVRWEDEYLHNMSLASKQKKYNKDLTQAKKNALFWVIGRGICSVGMGIGVSRTNHPLQDFCGEQLLVALSGKNVSDLTGRKRSSSFHDDDASSDEGRRVRPRVDDEEIETDLARGEELAFGDADILMQEEVEIGRHAPPSLQDDASSQMPWNITASIQGSIHGSASSLSRPFESMQLGGFGRLGGRLTSSSPLAGRGRALDPAGHDRLSSLSLTGNDLDDFDILDDFDMAAYLGGERDVDRADTFDAFGHDRDIDLQGATEAEAQEIVASLSQVDRNFLEFLKGRIKSEQDAVTADDATNTQPPESKKEITFSMLLPPEKMTRAVATQGLMHVLALATRDILAVHQDNGEADNTEGSEANGFYGEIYLRIREPYN